MEYLPIYIYHLKLGKLTIHGSYGYIKSMHFFDFLKQVIPAWQCEIIQVGRHFGSSLHHVVAKTQARLHGKQR